MLRVRVKQVCKGGNKTFWRTPSGSSKDSCGAGILRRAMESSASASSNLWVACHLVGSLRRPSETSTTIGVLVALVSFLFFRKNPYSHNVDLNDSNHITYKIEIGMIKDGLQVINLCHLAGLLTLTLDKRQLVSSLPDPILCPLNCIIGEWYVH